MRICSSAGAQERPDRCVSQPAPPCVDSLRGDSQWLPEAPPGGPQWGGSDRYRLAARYCCQAEALHGSGRSVACRVSLLLSRSTEAARLVAGGQGMQDPLSVGYESQRSSHSFTCASTARCGPFVASIRGSFRRGGVVRGWADWSGRVPPVEQFSGSPSVSTYTGARERPGRCVSQPSGGGWPEPSSPCGLRVLRRSGGS